MPNKIIRKIKDIFLLRYKLKSIFKDKRFYFSLIFIFLAIDIISIYLYTSSFSVYSGDDFVHYHFHIKSLKDFIYGNGFHNGIEYAKWDMANLGGRYFAMFLQAFLGITDSTKDLTQLSTIMRWNSIIYFISLFFVSCSIIFNIVLKKKEFLDKLLASSALFFSIVFLFNAFSYNKEVFTWLPGANSYTLPLSLFFISLGLITYNINNRNIVMFLLYIPFAILSMGGSLTIVSFGLFIIFILLLYLVIFDKLSLRSIIQIIIIFIAGFINVSSPGNFKRRSLTRTSFLMDDTIDIKEILNLCIKFLTNRVENINNKFILMIALIIISAIVSYFIYKNINIDYKYIILSAVMILLPFATTFPIALGYTSNQPMFDRICFIIDFSIIIYYINTFIAICGILTCIFNIFLKDNKNSSQIVILSIIIIVSAISLSSVSKIKFDDIDTIDVLNDIQQNKYEVFYEEYNNMFRELYYNKNSEHVVIDYPYLNDKPKYLQYDEDYHEVFFNIKVIEKNRKSVK